MNKLYLLFPVPKDEKNESLKILFEEENFKNGKEVFEYLKKIYQTIDKIGYEDYCGIYDQKRVNQLLNRIKDDNKLKNNRPSPELIIGIFNDWIDFHDDFYEKVTRNPEKDIDDYLKGYKDVDVEELDYDDNHSFLIYDNAEIKDTILNAYMQNFNVDAVALLNADVSRLTESDFQKFIVGKQIIPVKLLPVEFDDLHAWFSKHRSPQRGFDQNYTKHGEKTKLGKRGVISPLTYKSKEEIEPFLFMAVGNKDHTAKNLFFFDRAKGKYLYFWSENTPNQLYHAYEVKPENIQEINKIFSKGGRELKKLIDEVSASIDENL